MADLRKHQRGHEAGDCRQAEDQRDHQVGSDESGVPGLDSVYGVQRHRDAYEPASRGAKPVVEVWDTEAYLRHAPVMLAEVRDHVGPELKLLHDAHHRLTPIEAARLGKELEPLRLFWLEDVTPAENQQALDLVRQHTTTPLAIGEVFNTIWDCKDLIIGQKIDYVRTCVMHAGGISHVRRIFDLANLYQVKGAPHGPSDVSPLTMAASVHLGISNPAGAIQEYMGYPREVSEVFHVSYELVDGYLVPGEAPGLGVEFDEQAAAGFPFESAYLPVARDRDGSMHDW